MSRLVSIPLDAYPADALAHVSVGPFTLGAARAAMWLAQLAYEEETEKVKTVLARWRLSPLLVFDRPGGPSAHHGHTRGYLARADGLTIVSFGGTDPLVFANWITDFRFTRNTSGAHSGFVEAFDIMWDEIASTLLSQTPGPILFTGHSLGAALALICADRAREALRLEPAAVYGFGMPRVGDKAFADRLNDSFGARVYRLAHGEDIVPSLPPALLGFHHVGRYAHCPSHTCFAPDALTPTPSGLPGNGGGLADTAIAALRRLFSSPPPSTSEWKLQTPLTRLLPLPLADHLPDRYWKALERGPNDANL